MLHNAKREVFHTCLLFVLNKIASLVILSSCKGSSKLRNVIFFQQLKIVPALGKKSSFEQKTMFARSHLRRTFPTTCYAQKMLERIRNFPAFFIENVGTDKKRSGFFIENVGTDIKFSAFLQKMLERIRNFPGFLRQIIKLIRVRQIIKFLLR